MEAVLKLMQAVAEPTVIFSDIDEVSYVLASDGIPWGTYAVGTSSKKIEIVSLESESDNLQIAIRHEDYVVRLPLIMTGCKGSYSLCVSMPGCGPTDLEAFKVLWNQIHGYQLQQFEDEDGNTVKLVQTGVTAPKHNLRVTGTFRSKMLRPSEELDSDRQTDEFTDASETTEVQQTSQTEDVIDKQDLQSFGTSGCIATKSGTSDQHAEPRDDSELESVGIVVCSSAKDDAKDEARREGSGQPLRPECSESKATEIDLHEMSKRTRSAFLRSFLPKSVSVIAESSITLEAKIGNGRFSVVHEARLQIFEKMDVMNVMVERVRTKTKLEEIASFGRYVWALAALKHQNVVSLMCVCLDGDRLELLIDYIDGGTLKDYLKGPNVSSLTPRELVGMSRQVATGMEYIAGRGWLHGELGSTNILLTSALECKIAGFGSATLATDIQHSVNYPHSYAAAIEVHQDKDFTSKSDVWSFGILFMEIMSKGQTPYRGRVDPTQLKVYLEIGHRWKRPDCVSQEHYAIMQRCWKLKPRARPTFQQLVTELRK